MPFTLGWQWIDIRAKLWDALSVIERENRHTNSGLLCPEYTGNVPLPILTFGNINEKVIPVNRHRAVGKETGQTNPIERLNNTFRQRLSRLVRKSLSFSKKLDNHMGAIGYFIHDYNAQLAKG